MGPLGTLSTGLTEPQELKILLTVKSQGGPRTIGLPGPRAPSRQHQALPETETLGASGVPDLPVLQGIQDPQGEHPPDLPDLQETPGETPQGACRGPQEAAQSHLQGLRLTALNPWVWPGRTSPGDLS